MHIDNTKLFGEDLDKFFCENCEGYADLADDVLAAAENVSDNIRIGNTDYVRSQIKNMQKEYYLDNADIAPFMKRLDVFDKAKGKTISKEHTQEKPSIRKQLADNKAKAADIPKRKNQKNKDLVVEPMAEPYTKEIDNTLESLQKEVGGLIQATYPYDDLIAIVCNDEGKINGLELNRAVYDDERNMLDIIAGTFLVVGLSEYSFATLPDDMTAKYKEMFRQPQTFIRLNNEIVAIPVKPSIRKQLNINKEQGGRDGQKAPEHKPPEL